MKKRMEWNLNKNFNQGDSQSRGIGKITIVLEMFQCQHSELWDELIVEVRFTRKSHNGMCVCLCMSVHVDVSTLHSGCKVVDCVPNLPWPLRSANSMLGWTAINKRNMAGRPNQENIDTHQNTQCQRGKLFLRSFSSII